MKSASRSKKGAEKSETNQDIGLSRGGRNTKIHAVIDALDNTVKLYLTPGNVSDCAAAVGTLSNVSLEGSAILADKVYGSVDIREYIESRGESYCIPPKSNAPQPWECDFHHYKELSKKLN